MSPSGTTMIEIDGSRYSGSGTILRQAVAFGALSGTPVRVFNIRAARPKPGLRPQHVRVVEAIRDLVAGSAEGVRVGSPEVIFRPGPLRPGGGAHAWDVGSAGSTTLLALAALPLLAFAAEPVEAELRGGMFQDFAPSFFHLQHVILPLLRQMGLEAEASMGRPGYVPRGGGILRLAVRPAPGGLRAPALEPPRRAARVWGLALASHLKERQVGERMAEAARRSLAAAGIEARIEILEDSTAPQAGAALALFADRRGGARLGADGAGARGRPAEAIGRRVAALLLEDLRSGGWLDRYAGDQILPFAALASGETRFRAPAITEHMQSGAWLAREFLGAEVRFDGNEVRVAGSGFSPRV